MSTPRIAYVPTLSAAVAAAIATALVPLGTAANIVRVLSRHESLFSVWGELGSALLSGEIPARIRELVILRVAVLCEAEYEWAIHVGLSREAGLTDADLERVVSGSRSDGWTSAEAAAIQACDDCHHHNAIQPATWDALRPGLSDRQLIELLVLVGHYHQIAYLTNSLRIPPEPGLPRLGSVHE